MERIDANSVETLHRAFIGAREEFEAAIGLAEGRWEEPILEPEDSDDDPWPPHMAAGHALIGERWRFRYLTTLLAQPAGSAPLTQEAFAETAVGQEELSTRSTQYEALSGPQATVEAAAAEWESIDAVYGRLTDRDLERPAGMSDGQLGYLASLGQPASNDVRGCLLLAVGHLRDHAQQIRRGLGVAG